MRLSFKTKWPWNKEKTNFVEKITRQPGFRPKIHTLREDPNDRWKPGRKIDMTTGDRYHPVVFNSEECKSTQIVYISYDSFETPNIPKVYIRIKDCSKNEIFENNIRELSKNEVLELALNDGFDSIEDFYKWFAFTVRLKCIHWTDFKYKIFTDPAELHSTTF